MPGQYTRRQFLARGAAATAILTGPGAQVGGALIPSVIPTAAKPGRDYGGPNVVLIRFGGGVRRRETTDPAHTYSPYLLHELIPRGVLFPRMEIEQFHHYATSHGEGTLYLLTGRYDRYRDVATYRPEVSPRLLGARFEAKVPTLFESLRQAFNIPEHQTLLINSEDRGDEEFYNFSNHHLFGVSYRSQTLSLRQFKTWLYRKQLESPGSVATQSERAKKMAALRELEALDYRVAHGLPQGEALDRFWTNWRVHYGDSGLVNPRGDRLLTELALRAVDELQPRLLMVNYQDCDYVHWGYLDHYTRGISIMDCEVQRLVTQLEANPRYRNNTIFAIVPDCGRDTNPYLSVPCQHHFGTRSAHEIFALFFGPGIPKMKRVDRLVSQIDVAPTLARLMGLTSPHAEGSVLPEVFG